MPVPRRRAKSKACSARRFSRGDVPNHIRENLPEELSDLPADLIYATDLIVLEFSHSEAVDRAAEPHNSLVAEIQVLHGDGVITPWPRWADDAARSTYDDYVRVRQRQEDAMRWVQENRCPTPVSSSSSSDEEAGSSDVVQMVVDESGEEAGEEDRERTPGALASSQGQPGHAGSIGRGSRRRRP